MEAVVVVEVLESTTDGYDTTQSYSVQAATLRKRKIAMGASILIIILFIVVVVLLF